jgi:hypothetical protein
MRIKRELAARFAASLQQAARVSAPFCDRANVDVGQLPLEIDPTPDKHTLGPVPLVDCAERLQLCRARCCRMAVTLSRQDLDEGLAWDEEQPFRIAHADDGTCHYLDAQQGCAIYDRRPAMCRRYDCRADKRIWIDFERRIATPC